MMANPTATRGGVLLLLLAFLISGCSSGPLLYDVHLEPHTTISPNADGVDDLTRAHYSIGREALVTITLEDERGARHVWRDRERRAPGDYEGWFAGVVDGRVLSDGTYTLRVRAEPVGGGEAFEETVALAIRDADTEPPVIESLRVTPTRFSPNRDGIQDEVVISYSLGKEVSRVLVYLLDESGRRVIVPADELREPTEAGGHQHRFDAGLTRGALPPPDGEYTLYVEAYDRVGARDVATTTLTIEGGGRPLAQITRHEAEFSTEILTVGETLRFTTTVTNVGTVPIRTHGPPSGESYQSSENYNNYGEPIEDGAWRLGLDFEGNPVYNGRRYPYRWQLGRDDELTLIDGERYLMPGQSVTVSGGLRLVEPPPRERPGFWVGLIHENVEFVEDFVDTTYITIEYTPDLVEEGS